MYIPEKVLHFYVRHDRFRVRLMIKNIIFQVTSPMYNILTSELGYEMKLQEDLILNYLL
jgi:hypothetical protein